MIKNAIQTVLRSGGYELRRTRGENDRDLYLSLFDRESVEKKKFYNISAGGHFGFGCGFSHPLWTNIDVVRDDWGAHKYNPETDIGHDLLSMNPLPLESDSAELIHSHFTVEHISDEAARFFFNEVKRVLKPGGIFRVVSPNVDLDYRAYKSNDFSYFSWRDMFSEKALYEDLRYKIPLNQASMPQLFLVHFASNASTIHSDGAENPINDDELQEIFESNPFEDALNICTARCSMEKQKLYRQNHVNWWNQNKFERMLGQSGFKSIYRTGRHQSASPVMRQKIYFDELWTNVTIYMEARK